LQETQFDEPGDVGLLEEEIHKLDQEIKDYREKISQRELESADIIQAYEKAEREKNEFDVECSQRAEEMEKFRNQFQDIEDEIHKTKSAMEYYKNLMTAGENKIKEKEECIKVEQEKKVEELSYANRLSDGVRIETRRCFKVVNTEYQQVTKQLELTKNLNGNEEEITRKYIEMREKFQNIRDEINRQKLFLKVNT
jgi:chromosome segregation ATPase